MSLAEPTKRVANVIDDQSASRESNQPSSEYELERMRIASADKLLNKGLDNGAKAVYLAFATFGATFLMNFIAYLVADKSYMSSQQILWGAGMLCMALIVYFGFIFGYSLYMSADLRKKRFDIGSKKEPKG